MIAAGFVFFYLFAGIILIGVTSVIVYFISKLIFDSRSNKALNEADNGKQKKMLRPIAITGIVAGVLLVIYIAMGAAFVIFGADLSTGGKVGSNSFSVTSDEPSVEVMFATAGSDAQIEDKNYSRVNEVTGENIVCTVYEKKADDDSDSFGARYFVVCKYTGDSKIAIGNAMYTSGKNGSGSIIELGDNAIMASTSIWHIEFPGTLEMSFRDKDGNDVAKTSVELK